MKKKLSPIWAGVLALSILLSSCGASSEEAASPDPRDIPSASPAADVNPSIAPSAAPSTGAPSVEPKAQPPKDAGEGADAPAAQSPAPKDGAQPPAVASTPAPAVSTPKLAVSTPAPAVSTPAPAVSTPAPAAEPSPEPTPEPAPAVPAAKETASAFIGQSVSSLIAAIGQPYASDYAPSCLGSGEDGELFYNGFTVYTYREGNTEIVQAVI